MGGLLRAVYDPRQASAAGLITRGFATGPRPSRVIEGSTRHRAASHKHGKVPPGRGTTHSIVGREDHLYCPPRGRAVPLVVVQPGRHGAGQVAWLSGARVPRVEPGAME